MMDTQSAIRLWREIDPDRVNAVINHPSINPWVGGPERLDMAMILGEKRNVFLAGDHGLIYFLHMCPGIYECQPCVLPEGRGRWSIEFCRKAVNYMFTGTDCWEIMGGIPEHNRPSMAIARALHMTIEFSRPMTKPVNGIMSTMHTFRGTLQEWIGHYGDAYYNKGLKFIQQLQHVAPVPLSADVNTCRYVGITKAMLELGQAGKAVSFFNRWAYVTRQPTVTLLSRSPLVIAVGGIKLEFTADHQVKIAG